MAAAIVTVSVPSLNSGMVLGNKYQVQGTMAITVSPATYTTGGIACSLTHPLIKAGRTPISVIIVPQSGYDYVYVPGVDASTGKLKILVQDATNTNPLAEFTSNGAIPAAVSGDTINFTATFIGQN